MRKTKKDYYFVIFPDLPAAVATVHYKKILVLRILTQNSSFYYANNLLILITKFMYQWTFVL